MYSFSTIEKFDNEFNSLRKLSLAKLLSSAVDRSPKQIISAICYLDIEKLLVDDSQFVDQLLSQKNRNSTPLALWISNWDSSISVQRVVGYLSALRERLIDYKYNFCFVLPDPCICSEKARLSSLSLESFFRKFTSMAPCQTQPIVAEHSVFQLLKQVMSLGVHANLLIDLSLIEDTLNIARGPDHEVADDLILNRICIAAYELKTALSDFSNSYSIQTFSFSNEMKQTLSSPFAVPLVRTLCLLRHIFSPPVLLSASPGLLGKNLYLLINELGICSRLEGAFDCHSAESLNLPLLSEISRLSHYAD